MYCSKCGTKLEELAKFCSNCGNSMHAEKSSSKTTWIIIGIVLSLITTVVISIGIFNAISNTNKLTSDEQHYIEKTKSVETKNAEQNTKEEPTTSETEKDKTQVIKESMPKVFTVLTAEGQGSGFLYKEGGYIVTNAHVVAGYTEVVVRNHDGQESPAQVIGISDRSDIALLLAKDYSAAEPFSMELEQSIVGTEVIAIGSPQGFENSASIGYLTGTDRDIEYDFVYEELYQVDAQIDQGSSGGPLVDAKTGKVIGINSLLYTSNTSFGFSIPLYTVVDTIDSWIASPMSGLEVAALFDVYNEYTYADPATTEYPDGESTDYLDQYYEDYTYEDEYWDNYVYTFDEESLNYFILSFRDYYELALYYEDFYWISDMLLPGSTAYAELDEYIFDITGQDFYFEFTSNTVKGIEIQEDYAIVSTNEEFDFYNASGDHTYYNRNKDYTVVITEEGYYQISEIYIYE